MAIKSVLDEIENLQAQKLEAQERIARINARLDVLRAERDAKIIGIKEEAIKL